MDISILVVGVVFSSFYGFNAVRIFQRTDNKVDYSKYDYVWSWWVHQFWVNFICSMFGWGGVYNIFHSQVWLNGFSWEELLLIVTALVGVTGAMPKALFGVNISLGK